MRRTVGDKPPVLLLGAGASIDSGIGAMPELADLFRCADFDAFSRYIDTTTAAERYRYLAEFLQTRRPSEISPGYQALAPLCAQNYFDLVLTTNMDPLLDDALSAAQLWRRVPPIEGTVPNLAGLACVVAPGASGALDDTMAVRGFIVAGSRDPQNPWSLAYPAQHWASLLTGENRAKKQSRKKQSRKKPARR